MMVRPVLILVLALLVLNVAYVFPEVRGIMPLPYTVDLFLLNILLTVVILLPSYIWAWLEYKNFVYIIKYEELVIRSGIFRKRHNSIPYNKIRNVQRLQNILERIFGLCTISVETAEISFSFPNSKIPGMLNSKELPDLILKKTHADQDADTNLGETMRQVLSQLKDLNRRDQREEDRMR